MSHQPRVEIEYCTRCRWLLRAAWMAQELLSTFEAELGAVALIPGGSGVFEIRIADGRIADGRIADQVIWSRQVDGGFPDAKELKRRVRDRIAPDRELGHVDR